MDIKNFKTIPSDQELKDQFEAFIDNNEALKKQEKFKIGITSNLKTRYAITSKYVALEERMVFGKTESREIARKIEVKLQMLMKEKLITGDNTSGNKNSGKEIFIYVTHLKPPETKCFVCDNVWSNEEDKKDHLRYEHFKQIEDLQNMKQEIQASGIDDGIKEVDFLLSKLWPYQEKLYKVLEYKNE